MTTADHVSLVLALLSVSPEFLGVTSSPAHPWCGPCQFLNETEGQCHACPPHTFMPELRHHFISCDTTCSLVIHPSSHMTVEWPGNCSLAPVYGCESRYVVTDWENPLDIFCRRPRCGLCIDCTTSKSGGPEEGQSATQGLVSSSQRAITSRPQLTTNQTDSSYQPTSPSSQNETTPSQGHNSSHSNTLLIALPVSSVAVVVLMCILVWNRKKIMKQLNKLFSSWKSTQNISPNIPEQSVRFTKRQGSRNSTSL